MNMDVSMNRSISISIRVRINISIRVGLNITYISIIWVLMTILDVCNSINTKSIYANLDLAY